MGKPRTRSDDCHIKSPSLDISWSPARRLAIARFAPGIGLKAEEGTLLVESLEGWVGADGKPFGLLAETRGVTGADANYRSITRPFFEAHRDSAFVAVTHLGGVLGVIAEMFRVATGLQLKSFANDADARAWLRSRGVAA